MCSKSDLFVDLNYVTISHNILFLKFRPVSGGICVKNPLRPLFLFSPVFLVFSFFFFSFLFPSLFPFPFPFLFLFFFLGAEILIFFGLNWFTIAQNMSQKMFFSAVSGVLPFGASFPFLLSLSCSLFLIFHFPISVFFLKIVFLLFFLIKCRFKQCFRI